MVMASEVGVYDTDPANVALKVNFTCFPFLFCPMLKYKYYKYFTESFETWPYVAS